MTADFDRAEREPGIRKTVIVIVIFMAVTLGLFVHKVQQPRILSAKEMVSNGAIMFSTPRQISPLNLVDQNGDYFREQQLLGKWTFVFFGFTHCPDICPTTMALFDRVFKLLQDGEFASDTQFLLVSLDPARDTPEKLKTYVEYFNPEFIGVTGEFLDLHRFSKQLNVAFQKVVTDPETGDYTIDHGGNVALINPNGFYQGFYKPPLDANKIALTYRSHRMQSR